jgi:hypothetical protein
MRRIKMDAVKKHMIEELKNQIDEECYYKDIIELYNEYLIENGYEEVFYQMQNFENVCGDSLKKLSPKLAFDFSFDSEGFWFRNGKIYSGNIHKYYDDIVNYDMDSFAEWVYNNDFQYKLGLEV